jgi:hypothetical protein
MKNKVLISLVSDQTIPNVELIKEFQNDINEHVLISSKQTKEQMKWIINSTGIKNHKHIEVDAFDINDIEQKLRNYEFEDCDYILNITGGTKLMIIAFLDFFKNLGASIYYLTGQNLQYIKIFPAIGKRDLHLRYRLSLEEYLLAYGFEFNYSQPYKDFYQSKKVLDYYLNNCSKEDFKESINEIRQRRGKTLDFANSLNILGFLSEINYTIPSNKKLNKYDTKYLSGDWFEEYVFYKIKDELNLNEVEIATGVNLQKKGSPNEIDVLFVYKNKLYIIECKTSIFDIRILPNGKSKEINLLSEVIYKSDALRGKFGLFANTSIVTIDEIKNDDGTPIDKFKVHFERADLSRITIISRKDIIQKSFFKELLNIR